MSETKNQALRKQVNALVAAVQRELSEDSLIFNLAFAISHVLADIELTGDHTYEEISPMQKRHFERLASAVRQIREDCVKAEQPLSEAQIEVLTNSLADFCQSFDTAVGFNRTKFRKACKR